MATFINISIECQQFNCFSADLLEFEKIAAQNKILQSVFD